MPSGGSPQVRRTSSEDKGELPTFVLTERRMTTCRLARQDVDFLLGVHRAYVELASAGRRGYYRLRPRGHVGTIVCPASRLLIRPKIPVESLFYLLDPTSPVLTLPDQVTPSPGVEGLDFLACRLAGLLTERAGAGLHRAYQERVERGTFLQGQVDLTAQLRGWNGRKDQLHCRFEEFTADVPCNQVPKATAELVLRSPLLGQGVRDALRRALEAFASVTSVAVDRDSFSTFLTDRLTEAYQPLLDLCRILVESLRPGGQAGSLACPAFLLDMDRVFERYVTTGIVRAHQGSSRCTVAMQPLFTANRPDVRLPEIQLRPDFMIMDDCRPLLVGDAKWKRLPGSPLVTADLYQLITYCTALGVKYGLLVYPGQRDRHWKYCLARAPLTVEIHKLRVTGNREVCARSLQRFADTVRKRRSGEGNG